MRQLEWIGQRSVFSDPVVEFKMITGQYSDADLRLLRKAAAMRNVRVDGVNTRELRPDSPEGLSRYYRFGRAKGSYVQPVTDNDARIILNHPRLRNEFVDVTDEAPHGPNVHPLVLPEQDINQVRDPSLGRW